MRVYVLSITAGQGHNATGMALVRYFKQMGIECEFMDTYETISPILAKTFSEAYTISTKAKKPYSKFYRLIEKRRKNADDMSIARIANFILSSKISDEISSFAPDVIICTHCLCAAIADLLKQRGKTDAKIIGIVTDFTMHPFWEEAIHIDYLVTPSELISLQAYKKGFSKEQLLPTGIPINPKFSKRNFSKEEMRKILGLDTDKYTILLMSGSMGFGSIEKNVERIDNIDLDFQVIVVSGNNDKAKRKIEKMQKKKKYLIYGYVDNIDELMDAADCIITKPGGLTTSEALAKNLPIIISNPIPGQEDRNSEFLLNNGAAMMVSKTCPLEEVLFQFMTNTVHAETMLENIARLSRPESTKSLCEFVAKLK